MEPVNLFTIFVSFAIYTLLIIVVGLYSARYARKEDEDFFLAGRGLGVWIAAFSASASSESGWVTLGLVGWAFTEGVAAYWIIPGCLLGFAFNWFILAGPLRERSGELNAITLPDYLAFHYNERLPFLRIMSVIVILTAMVLYVAAQFAAAGKAFSTVFPGVDYSLGVVIGAVIVLIYTFFGGFRAVCWTDFLQALLMIIALVFFPLMLLVHFGGISNALAGLPPEMLRFTPDKAGIAFLGFLFGSGALGINFGYPGQPHVIIRFMALKSRKEVFLGGIISIVWGFCVYWGAVTVGLFARAMSFRGVEWTQLMLDKPDIFGELGLILSAMHMLPGVLSGLILAAILAAICSTADSQLVVAASSLGNDIMRRIAKFNMSASSMIINRVSVLAIGFIALLLVINQEIRVYKYVLTYGWAILGASFGPQIILSLFWKRSTYIGCLAGMITGFSWALIWQNIYDAANTGIEIYNLPFAFVLSFVIHVVVSLLFPKIAATDHNHDNVQK